MTNRAKRMIEYLQDQLGYTVYVNKVECSVNKYHWARDSKFCPECGAKTKTIKDTQSVKDIESAIKYALKETE